MFLFSIIGDKNNSSKPTLNEVTEKYYLDIYKYCMARLDIDKDSAYDVTNEVFELFCKKWTKLENKNYKSWLYETADNLLKNSYKKYIRKLEKEIHIDDDPTKILSYEQNFENINEYIIENYRTEILESLTEEEKQLFIMSCIEKLSRTQISEKLSMSENTVKQRIFRLREKIKTEVKNKTNDI